MLVYSVRQYFTFDAWRVPEGVVSGSRKKILDEKFLDPKFALEHMGIEVSANETRCLCSLPAVGV